MECVLGDNKRKDLFLTIHAGVCAALFFWEYVECVQDDIKRKDPFLTILRTLECILFEDFLSSKVIDGVNMLI